MATAVFSHKSSLRHITPAGHAEQVARIEYVQEALGAVRFEALDRRDAPECSDADILLCHPQSHLDAITIAEPESGTIALDGDTYMSPGSTLAARHAVGGCLAAVDAVIAGDVGNAFVACRPPGHHAEQSNPMGFCLFGTAAIAAKHALERHGVSRVAVVDFDVHHGNGTQALLWDEARSLFIGSHQNPLWPGTGMSEETGAQGNVMNLPLPPHSDGRLMRATYEAQVFPALEAFAPELLIISAGFDAHKDDPLAQLEWTEGDFVWLTERLCDVADKHCGGRVVSTLEGGYDLNALAASVAAHVGVLMERAK